MEHKHETATEVLLRMQEADKKIARMARELSVRAAKEVAKLLEKTKEEKGR